MFNVFGYRRDRLRQYIDVALFAVGSIAALWAVVLIGANRSGFELKLGVVAVGVVVLAVVLSASRATVIAGILMLLIVRGILGFVETDDPRGLIVAGLAAVPLCLILFFFKPFRTGRWPT